MSDQPSTGRVVRFGVFEADLTTGELRKSGVRVKLEQQPFQVLRVLLQRPGELVTREELREEVWSDDTFVDFDQSLNTAIRKLRDTLGDSASHPHFIETLPRRGYRFVGAVDGPRPSEAVSQSPPPAPVQRFGFPAILAAFLLGAAIVRGLGYVNTSGRISPPAPNYSVRQVTFDPGLTYQPALSRDGNFLAYSSDRSGEGNLDIWVQQLGGSGEPTRLTNHPADDSEPHFSPDGRTIAFRSEREGGGVYLVPALGGDSRLLVKNGRRPRFSPDGSLVAYWVGPSSRAIIGEIGVVSAVGGEPRRLAADLGETLYPIWSPDGTHLMFAGSRQALPDWDWWVTSVKAGELTKTNFREVAGKHGVERSDLELPTPEAWDQAGHIVFSTPTLGESADTAGIWQVPISSETWRVEGSPVRLTRGSGETEASLAADGAIAFAGVARNIDVWSLPIDVDQGRVTGEPARLTTSGAIDYNVSISGNGRLITFASNRSGNSDLWAKDLVNGNLRALTLTPWAEFDAVVSDDGSTVAYLVFESPDLRGNTWVELRNIAEEVSRKISDQAEWPIDFSSDGRLVVLNGGFSGRAAARVVNIASGETVATLAHPDHNLYQAHLSPDDDWLVFHVHPTPEKTQVSIAPFREGTHNDPDQWIPVTDGQALDDKPRWSPNGNLIYMTSDRDGFTCLWAQPLDPETKHPNGPALAIRHFHQFQNSLGAVQVNMREIGVARDKIVMPLAELSGNIWLMEPVESGADEQP